MTIAECGFRNGEMSVPHVGGNDEGDCDIRILDRRYGCGSALAVYGGLLHEREEVPFAWFVPERRMTQGLLRVDWTEELGGQVDAYSKEIFHGGARKGWGHGMMDEVSISSGEVNAGKIDATLR